MTESLDKITVQEPSNKANACVGTLHSRFLAAHNSVTFNFILPKLHVSRPLVQGDVDNGSEIVSEPRGCRESNRWSREMQTLGMRFRVRTGPGKPGKSWNLVMAFSRTGKSWKKATGPGKSWKSV